MPYASARSVLAEETSVLDKVVANYPMRDWLRDNYRGSDKSVFSESEVPWVTAPMGPADAIDNPQFQEICMQWAARMFKTNFGQAVQMRQSHLNPCLQMFVTVDEELCKRVLDRYWSSVEECPVLAKQVPQKNDRNVTSIKLSRSTLHGSWPMGKSRLADASIRVGHANEVDKWGDASTSTEGDPLPRFLARGGEYPDRKFIIESTPSESEKSRIESKLMESIYCRYYVPCPHCRLFQPIDLKNLIWDKDDGRSDPNLAAKTVRMVCIHCKKDIEERHKPEMINLGVWVPKGCDIDHGRALTARECKKRWEFIYPWLKGYERHEANRTYGCQISSLYATFRSWSEFVGNWIRVNQSRNVRRLRQVINEELGETWKRSERKEDWQQLYEKMVLPDVPKGVVPAEMSIVVCAIDKQKDHYKYEVVAFGPGGNCHTVEYGRIEGAAQQAQIRKLLNRKFKHEDGGLNVPISMTLIDSGDRPGLVGKLCKSLMRTGLKVYPCRGSSTKLDTLYILRKQAKGKALAGLRLCTVDSTETQDWIEGILFDDENSDEGDIPARKTIHAGSEHYHEDYIKELMNDQFTEEINEKTGLTKSQWVKMDTSFPNDYRDTSRYAFAAAMVVTKGSK